MDHNLEPIAGSHQDYRDTICIMILEVSDLHHDLRGLGLAQPLEEILKHSSGSLYRRGITGSEGTSESNHDVRFRHSSFHSFPSIEDSIGSIIAHCHI
jgi:hypothetical protein